MTHHDRGTTWFLAQLKPNSHRIAERNLARQGVRTFLPLQEETKRARGRFTTQMRPLFPGYLFVAFDVDRQAAGAPSIPPLASRGWSASARRRPRCRPSWSAS